jgi:cation diffusion facilitator CzcD-associated flavoprotein CzcO
VFSYSPAAEILAYFQHVAEKYELYKYIRLSHKVINACWSESRGIWDLRIENLITGELVDDWCHFLVNGSGILK